MVVLALGGYRGSGKDTAAEFLIKQYKYQRLAFADKLKDNVARDFGIERGWLDDSVKKEQAILTMPVVSYDRFSKNTITFMAKEFAAKTGENFDYAVFSTESNQLVGVKKGGDTVPLYWSPRALAILEGSTKRSVNPHYWVDFVAEQAKVYENVVITDMRYKSEAARLKEIFGSNLVTVRIVRNESKSDDPSERDLDDYIFDQYVYNLGTKEHLYENLQRVAGLLKLPGFG